MTWKNWTIRKRPRGFEINYVDPDTGDRVASYPTVRKHIPFAPLFYPYILKMSVKAILEHLKTFQDARDA